MCKTVVIVMALAGLTGAVGAQVKEQETDLPLTARLSPRSRRYLPVSIPVETLRLFRSRNKTQAFMSSFKLSSENASKMADAVVFATSDGGRGGGIMLFDTDRLPILDAGQIKGNPILDKIAKQRGKRSFENFTFDFVPSQVPDAALINGGTANVLHFDVSLENPKLFGKDKSYRTYLKSDNTFSSNSLDTSTSIDLKTGLLLWVGIPKDIDHQPDEDDRAINLDLSVGGNQHLSTGTFLISAGYKNPFGKDFLLGNVGSVFNAEEGAKLLFSARYENRFRQDARVSDVHARHSTVQAYGEFLWNDVHLFSRDATRDTDATLDISLKGWYIPDEEAVAAKKARKWEGRIDVLVFIPLRRLTPVIPGEDIRSGIAIRYTDGANEMNNYARYSHFTIGIEATKSF
jgi:hypothetical protein